MSFEKLKKTLETLKFGEHLACIYKNKTEQFSAVIPFIVVGLKNNDKCIYIIDESTKKEVIHAFKKVIDIEEYIKKNQLELLTKEDAYLKEGYFDPDQMIELLKQNESKAIKEGYNGLRVTGEMTWIFTRLPGVERLIEYEAKLNYFFPESRCTALCQYNEEKFTPEILLDIIHTHPKIIIYDSLCENLHYLPPDEFFARIRGEVQWDTYEKAKNNIIHKKKAEEKAKRIQRERNLVLESMSEPVLYYGKDKRIKWVNRAAAETFHAEPKDLVGKICYEVLHNRVEPCEDCPVYRAWETGMYEKGEVLLLDGRIGYVKANPVYEGDELVGIVEIVEDITERKRAEIQLKNLFKASKLINSTMDTEKIFNFVSDSIQELVGFDNLIVFLVSKDRKMVHPAYTSGEIAGFKGMTFSYGEGLVGRCIKTGDPLLIKDAHKEGGKIIDIPEMKSQIFVPLIIEDECVGALHVSKSTVNAYDREDVAALRPLSEVISSAIRNSNLYTEIIEFSKELERRVKEKSRRTEILLGVKQTLQIERSWKKGLITIVESMSKLGFARCSVFLVNPMKKTLTSHFSTGSELPAEDVSISLKDTEYIGVRSVLEKRTIHIKEYNPQEGRRIFSLSDSFVWVPIVVQNEAFAAIVADSGKSNTPIAEEDVKDLEILAGMCAAFIDRTRTLIEPVAEKTLKTEFKHWLDPSECYIVTEKKPEKSFEIFVDLVTHGIPGFVISREHPEKIKRKYTLAKTPILWLSQSEIENTLNPGDLSKLNFIVGSFIRKSTESVILLDGLEYLISHSGFWTVFNYMHELKDSIVSNNSRLIIPLHKGILPPEEYHALEREFTILEPGNSRATVIISDKEGH